MTTEKKGECLQLVDNYMGLAIGALYSKTSTQRENKKFVSLVHCFFYLESVRIGPF